MKSILTTLLCAALLVTAAGQDNQGMKFEHGLTWKQILEKAKKENKHIFMDAFTTWCGPCKYMAANIFPTREAGEFFNDKFINVKVQLDTTDKDNEEVKKWYADAHKIMVDYNVRVFPTYLYFSPDGELVHRAVGASETAPFIAKSKLALDPSTQYYTMLKKYRKGEKDPAFLRKLALAALEAYDRDNIGPLADAYLATQNDLYTRDNLEFLMRSTNSTKDKGFAVILQNPAKVDEVMGKKMAGQYIVDMVMSSEVYPVMFRRNATAVNFDSLKTVIAARYADYSDEIIGKSKVTYYQSKRDWNNFQAEVVAYMKKYGDRLSPAELNEFAWAVFENCPDMKCVSEALEWSKRSFAEKENHMFIDTYANILYKMGKKEEAITWQTKALNLAPEGEKAQYQQTLDKMKKGEKTWKHN